MENQIMMGSNPMSMFISYLYENNVLKMLNENVDTTAVKDISNGIKDAFVAKANEIIDLQADFTAEYTTAMNIMNPPSHQ
jgi:glutamate 5-kinase